MRARYNTTGIILARTPLAEASALIHVLTEEFGLVRARAQGVRGSGAKLASATQTLSESDIIILRGKEGWRLSGAVLLTNWHRTLTKEQRACAGRVARLLLRLIHGESHDVNVFYVFQSFVHALSTLPADYTDAAEQLVVLRLLHELGFDAEPEQGSGTNFSHEILEAVAKDRKNYLARINRGISASGL